MASKRLRVDLSPRLKQFQKRLTYRALRDVLAHYAIAVWRGGVKNAPVRTGRLRQEIGYVVRPTAAEVRSGAPYSGYVEFGTRRQKAQRFMARAVKDANKALPSFIEKAVNKWL